MYHYLIFQDTQCIMPNCSNMCPWDSYSTMCAKCYKKVEGLQYCHKCKKICNTHDISGVSYMIQHITDFRCTKCNSKPIPFVETIKGFGYKH